VVFTVREFPEAPVATAKRFLVPKLLRGLPDKGTLNYKSAAT